MAMYVYEDDDESVSCLSALRCIAVALTFSALEWCVTEEKTLFIQIFHF